MPSLKSIIVKYITLNKFGLWILLVVILLILATLYAYNYFYLPNEQNKKFKHISNDGAGSSYAYGNGKSVIIKYFWVEWCPYCKKSQTDWENFSANYNGRVMNEYTIECQAMDCTESDNADVKSNIDKYDIKGYPTIKMEKDGKVIDFDAKVTSANLTNFVDNLIKPKNDFFKNISDDIKNK